MKFNKTIKITSTLLFLTSILFTYTHCDLTQSTLNKSNYSDGSYSDENHGSASTGTGDTEEEKLVTETVDVGIKNFEEILVTMSSLTGVDQNNSNIQKLYNEVKNLLPSDNEIKSFGSSSQVAIMKLASEYCNEVQKSQTLRSSIWPNINFNQKASLAFTTANKDLFIINSLKHFLPYLEESEDLYKDYAFEILNVSTELLRKLPDTNETTRKVAFGACTILLSSLEVNAI